MTADRTLTPAEDDEVRAVLDRAGLPDDPARFVELVKDAVRSVVVTRHAADPSALTAGEVLELRDVGLDPLVSAASFDAASGATAARMAAILADSLSVEDAAELMQLHRSRLRQMLLDRSLYGIKTDGEWRIPAFQFAGRRQIRNLAPVLRALPVGLHPIELYNWLHRPEPALLIEGRPVPPVRWLEHGGDAGRVAALAADL